MLTAPISYQRDPSARQRLRERLSRLFRRKQTNLSQTAAMRLANVALQTLKGLSPLYSDATEAERHSLIAEYKVLLTAYLEARLSGDRRPPLS